MIQGMNSSSVILNSSSVGECIIYETSTVLVSGVGSNSVNVFCVICW